MHLITRNVNTLRTAVAVLGFVLLTGCTMPRYMVGLDTVLTEELGTDTPIVPDYPCTIGAHRENLIRLKPRDKTIVFWNFKDKMYVVHKDMSDRMWGDSFLKTVFNRMRYRP